MFKSLFRTLIGVGLLIGASCALWQDSIGEPGKWLILVYLDGDNNLESSAMEDFNELELGFAKNHDVNVLVLFDRVFGESTDDGDWTGTRLYWIQPDNNEDTINSRRLSCSELGLSDEEEDELNMGDPNTLRQFVQYAQQTFPGDYTALILWNHGDGWKTYSQAPYAASESFSTRAICEDVTSADILDNWEIAQALSGLNITVLGMDACSMGSIEVAYELKDSADYLIASADAEPVSGWVYDELLARFLPSDQTPANFYHAVVDTYAVENAYNANFTLSVYDLSQTQAVFNAFNQYSEALLPITNDWWSGFLDAGTNSATPVHETFSRTEYYSDTYEVDLYELVGVMPNAYTETVRQAVGSMVVYEWHAVDGDIHTGNPYAHGISVYYDTPRYSDLNDYLSGNIRFVHDGNAWVEFLGTLSRFPPFEIAGQGSYSGTLSYREEDLYQVYVELPGTIELTLDVPVGGDDDLYLYYEGNLKKVSMKDGDANESIGFQADDKGWYIIRVYRYDASYGSYRLDISGTAGLL